MAGTTPSQTVGPFFSIALDGPNEVADGVWVRGRVVDGAGEPVPDALIETWQAAPERLFARCPTGAGGEWAIRTLKAPYIDVSVFARGLLHRVVTRIYFADSDNAADPVLASVEPGRRATLLAVPDGDGYRFDIHLQGDRETVFFAV